MSYKLTWLSGFCRAYILDIVMKQVFLGLIFLVCSSAYAMGIEQAYQLITHQRTVFQLHKTNLPASEAQQVARLLKLAETAMVERVNALHNGSS